jgi:predicted SprT family Zn-dependent metalloprotease
MAYITLEEAQALANRSCQESWDEMIRILTEQGLEKVVTRIGKAPKIEWRRMKSSMIAGYYHFPTIPHPGKVYNLSYPPRWDDRIEMNTKYLDSKDAIQFIWDTTKHELGHCLNYRINKRKNHDAAFRAIVTAIGGDPSTYHNYEDSEVGKPPKRQSRTEVKCKCGVVFQLTPIRMKRAAEGIYTCRKCKENLKNLI